MLTCTKRMDNQLIDSFLTLNLHQPHLGWMDADVNGSTVGLLTLDALDVDAKLLAIALDNLADLKRKETS